MKTSNDQIEALRAEAEALSAEEVQVETNGGTYGAAEAYRKIRCGDPQFADRAVWERVGDGQRRSSGPEECDAPGRMRHINTDYLANRRARLADVRRLIVAAHK